MGPAFINPFDFVFLVVPFIAVLAHRNVKSIGLQAALIAGYSFVGWLVLFAASWYTDTQWVSWIESLPTPSPQQIELFNSDGASKGVLLLFGLPISFGYVLVVWMLSRVVTFVVHRVRKHA